MEPLPTTSATDLRRRFFARIPKLLPTEALDLTEARAQIEECQAICSQLRLLAIQNCDVSALRDVQTLANEVNSVTQAIQLFLRAQQERPGNVLWKPPS